MGIRMRVRMKMGWDADRDRDWDEDRDSSPRVTPALVPFPGERRALRKQSQRPVGCGCVGLGQPRPSFPPIRAGLGGKMSLKPGKKKKKGIDPGHTSPKMILWRPQDRTALR